MLKWISYSTGSFERWINIDNVIDLSYDISDCKLIIETINNKTITIKDVPKDKFKEFTKALTNKEV